MMFRLYIDPGTGSMLFTILIGLVSALLFVGRRVLVKLQFFAQGGRTGKTASDSRHKSFVIFSDHKRYWNVFEPVCEEFEKRGVDLFYLTCSPDDPALSKTYSHIHASFIGEGNAAFAKLNILRADIVLSTTPNLDVYQWKRSKDAHFYVHILHAANDTNMYNMFALDYYDAVLLSGEYQYGQVRELERVRMLPEKELVYTGLTYLDEMAKRLRLLKETSLPETEGRTKTILVAPSWGVNSLLHRFGERLLTQLKTTGYHIVIRPHPQMLINEKAFISGLQEQFPPEDGFEWNTDNDNFDVLARTDLLISDFSGIIFDFVLVFDKPLIYTDSKFDDARLDCWWTEEAPWTFQILPKIGQVLKEDNLEQTGALIEQCLTDERYAKARDMAREETWMYRGEAAVRCVDYLLKKQQDIREKGRCL